MTIGNNNVNIAGSISNNKKDKIGNNEKGTFGNVKHYGWGRKQLAIIKMNVTSWGDNEKS